MRDAATLRNATKMITTQGIDQIISDFLMVSATANFPLRRDEIMIEFSPAPHARPKSLPTGMMAVYIFCTDTHCLKVGKAGAKTKQRYTYQHYNARSAPSTLAASLLGSGTRQDGNVGYWSSAYGMPATETVGEWIEANTTRVNLLIKAQQSPFLLNLLEAFVQCRLRPVFEGRGVGSTAV